MYFKRELSFRYNNDYISYYQSKITAKGSFRFLTLVKYIFYVPT